MVTIVPTAASTLHRMLVQRFPHKRLPVEYQSVFLMNVLRTMVYVPSIRVSMMAAIVDRLVDIDVSVATHSDAWTCERLSCAGGD